MSYPPRGPRDGLIGQGGPVESDHQRLERKIDELKTSIQNVWALLNLINHTLINRGLIPENRP